MKLNADISKLPEKYICNEEEYYLDPVRKALFRATPEETIRQNIVAMLLENNVPGDMIDISAPLSQYGIQCRYKADVLIGGYCEEEECGVPAVIIKCKSPDKAVSASDIKTLLKYADELGTDYAAVTNGDVCRYFHYSPEKKQFELINEFPSYEELISNGLTLHDPVKVPDRIPFNKLNSDGTQAYIGQDIGEDTPEEMQTALINLWECLLDENYILPAGEYGIFKVIKDLGVRICSYGNASGGLFEGPYRSFLIEYKGSAQIVSLGLSTYYTYACPDIIETVIAVAVDNADESHHSLELVADDNLICESNSVKFYHSGKISIGNIGSGKSDELRSFVDQQCPELIDGKRFYLGELKNDRLWHLSDDDVSKVVENLISYALVRDEYRWYVKGKRKMEI
ncbi:MAG: type I restriction enzyme HsdR N-terminal domain-containing protein [Oscillospiraceae bacterium]|nr:type I restriction enzyme HsdR N-terminal domain-containing protein [Oscillospiraceae bacterium]